MVRAEQSNPVTADQLVFAAGKNVDYTTRALRASDSTDEERCDVSGLSKVAGFLLKAGPSAENLANKLWLSGRTDPMKVFKILRLRQAGVKLDDNPRVVMGPI
ncbi:hypothetical protein PHYSODRAFT_284511 [Phytophthora sojae]|uniref:RxLR effector PexRD54 WY domain-containing protein n=1 Tax=Phytophthora sojae (strain P6497) TaxID=1094619 RepID=G4YL46_PHYSP|nr:hypothetical protein PHYSODRAFT_284511 [Phytophthora sojae]EGZ29801.1 hypothetical protein PHYSODRAFT_284511 [Phytophthora sojae]|eukprot:XP_009517076.1 hypothetical protein PHYSODRAFT_284511 [Phytophthora sojae]